MTPVIREAMSRHGSAVLQFSGGKDSLAVLHACRPWADRIRVMWTDTGDSFPHVREYIFAICELWGFALTVVEADVLDYVERTGLPTDLVPFWATAEGAAYLPEKPGQLLQSPFSCCWANLWAPLQNAVKASGTTLVIRGSKGTDKHVGVPSGYVEDSIEYLSPAWDMTDDDVMAYLAEHGVYLPLQYRCGVVHSLDCMTCTAWLSTDAERQRIEFTRGFYPEKFAELQAKSSRVWDEIGRQTEALRPSLEALSA